jgi:hypothetical protein
VSLAEGVKLVRDVAVDQPIMMRDIDVPADRLDFALYREGMEGADDAEVPSEMQVT